MIVRYYTMTSFYSNKKEIQMNLSSTFSADLCISWPPGLCLSPDPGSGPQPWPQPVFAGPGPQFVFTGPGPKFLFTGTGPNFLCTGPGQSGA